MASQLCDTPSIHECNASLSPWEQLPTELIRAIVRLSVSPHLCFPLEHGRRDPHLQITQICSSWRAIACSMSNLWGLTFYQDLILESSIELATSLLNQDPTTLLSLEIHRNLPPTFPVALYKGANVVWMDMVVTKLVFPNSQRLKSLELILWAGAWDTIRPLNFANLTSLKITIETTIKPAELGPHHIYLHFNSSTFT